MNILKLGVDISTVSPLLRVRLTKELKLFIDCFIDEDTSVTSSIDTSLSSSIKLLKVEYKVIKESVETELSDELI